MTITTVSCPGKVLLAGGYLVLERPNVGLVIAADKKFYSQVSYDSSLQPGEIVVNSPQFHSSWKYSYQNETLIPCIENMSMNDFVEKSLRVCLLFLSPDKPPKLTITIKADNEFYSLMPHLKSTERSPEAVQRLEKFLPCPKDEEGKAVVNKTGLGSSAALVTSLVGALVLHFQPSSSHERIHNLAQICHCYAQGKVGSGFDVSAACHGTHVYRRFPKCLLPDLLQQLEVLESHSNNAREALERLVEMTPWADSMVDSPLHLPRPLQIVLADVCGGSESPSMAKKVLHWKQQEHLKDPTAPIRHWDDLKQLNEKIVELFKELDGQQFDDGNNGDFLDSCSKQVASEWPSDSILFKIHSAFLDIRRHLKQMGDSASVPIEPIEQTALCDATMKLPGVVAAIVPGAGGYDAIACLYIDRPYVLESIGKLWATYDEPVVCPLGLKASKGGMSVEKTKE